ncbi:3'-5' exonuclease [Pseudothauera nasutitermitis]|uniref:3'-5' exonuclease n=1 Tax=Pseudothauera nasutitermitis TaxID=2565930 RepID=A0A4S4AMG0_9RHOO|nr:3'-5' exonuclease [Pseudothauera nasutitermitis]THF60754.1 3'-5' exonuclease [Pseudothauera nasutitermitis]
MLYLGPPRDPGAPSVPRVARADLAPDWTARCAALAAEARDPRLCAFYAAGAPAGDTPLGQVELVAVDVETTGLDPERDEIVSVGLVPFDLTRIRASASRHWIVRPRRALDAESVAVHGITHSQVADAPDFTEVLGELLEQLAGRVVVAHCAPIERGFLAAACRERLGEVLEFPAIDTMELEARAHRQPPSVWAWLAGLFGRRAPVPSIRLAAARARYGLPRYRPHHAAVDALAAAELLQAQVAHRYAADTSLAELWS